ncbi:TadE/TadG family type IV pilus assembly protein [Microlunatus speluncae]|uniref:TadE/TadG family type IV pilus assembly protein n=1 Tax=Microlunatus speluncae TaxID=2594267 RepID=UPI001266385B|nr:TadE/TadG family type IV pilus assembly protein [Microlunatus speluncae]
MRATHRHRSERGAAESLQLVLIWPVVLLATVAVIQTGLWLHGRNIAVRAAAVAVDEARGATGTTDRGRALAIDLATTAGLTEVKVVVLRIGDQVEARVTGRAAVIIDFGLSRMDERAVAPLERVPGR